MSDHLISDPSSTVRRLSWILLIASGVLLGLSTVGIVWDAFYSTDWRGFVTMVVSPWGLEAAGGLFLGWRGRGRNRAAVPTWPLILVLVGAGCSAYMMLHMLSGTQRPDFLAIMALVIIIVPAASLALVAKDQSTPRGEVFR